MDYVEGLEAVHESEGTWVKAGEDFVNMALVTSVVADHDGYYVFCAESRGDPDGWFMTAKYAANILAYIAAHTWTNMAE
jgi:hypothetical protein